MKTQAHRFNKLPEVLTRPKGVVLVLYFRRALALIMTSPIDIARGWSAK